MKLLPEVILVRVAFLIKLVQADMQNFVFAVINKKKSAVINKKK